MQRLECSRDNAPAQHLAVAGRPSTEQSEAQHHTASGGSRVAHLVFYVAAITQREQAALTTPPSHPRPFVRAFLRRVRTPGRSTRY